MGVVLNNDAILLSMGMAFIFGAMVGYKLKSFIFKLRNKWGKQSKS